MLLVLRYPNGTRVDALLLSRETDRLRVALHGRNDTIELQLVFESWMDEDGRRVSIEAILTDSYHGGRQTKTKYTATADAASTATAAIRSKAAGRMD